MAGLGFVPRDALRRVLESKLRAELAAARGASGTARAGGLPLPPSPWAEELSLFGDAQAGLGCDSLERLWLAGAVNEMFHLHETGAEDYLLIRPQLRDWLDIVEASFRKAGRLTFLTSGSTGEPKRCPHALADLLEECGALAAVFEGRARVVSFVPPHHIYGFLFTVLLPEVLGIPVWDASDASPAALVNDLARGDLLVSFPDRWRYLERSISTFPNGVLGTTSTSPCPPSLIEQLLEKGLDGVVEIYGSSETGGIGIRKSAGEPYSLLPHWLDPELDHAGPGPARLVTVSGRRVTAMDDLIFTGTRRFTIAGRSDGAVQVGGLNVFPLQVARKLQEHPLVAQAAVRLMRPEEGARLKAFIVLAHGVAENRANLELAAWIESELPVAQRPKAIRFGDALPRDRLGKPADW